MRELTIRLLTAGLVLAASSAFEAQVPGAIPGLDVFGPAPIVAQEETEETEFREARRAISRGQFDRAVELFSALRDHYPVGQYAPEAYYWEAFSRYRMDGFREALALLQLQLADFPNAEIAADSRDLELRIQGRLADRGDARAAQHALLAAEAALARTSLGQGLGATYLSQAAVAGSALQAQWAARRLAMLPEMNALVGTGPVAAQEGCEEEDVQQAALQALMQIETDRALPILRRVLQRDDECSVPLRKQAIFVLSQHDPAEVEELMISVARNDPEPEVQEAAVFWLSAVGTDRALDALADILSNTDDARLQENAIFALSQQGNARAGDLLQAYALDSTKPERVREKAIFWLSQHSDRADVDFLIDLYGQLGAQSLKESVFFSLSNRDEVRATEWMLERALDTAEPVELRKQALFWAGQHPSIDLSRLNGLYERLTDREMKEQLIFLYSQRPEAEAVDQMIQIVRSETDPELRKRAIFWLGQTGDERAVEFLLEVLGDPPR